MVTFCHVTYVSYLTDLPAAYERLKIFEADLNKPETFDAPIKGCIGVFHVAHPIDFEGKEPEQVQTERAIKGSLGILQACVDSKTVKKVVYTSSASTFIFNGKTHTEVLDEESWSDIDFIHTHFNEFGAPYFVSKTLTEKATLRFGEENGLDVVTIIPTYIHGPFAGSRCPGSVRASMAMIFGDTTKYDMLTKTDFVHVDDVVRAHIHLLEYPHAKGSSFKDAEKMKFPGVSSRKLLSTGFQFKYGLEEMFDDAITCCKQHNIL
ncbi:putative (3R)-2'-hydroxyisoflavanone reductase [Helianthus annuus]|nr:putative (3R)-2'-hydroxyisoflavanone reductase [Helianthus annuus]KAJ0598361.1 putative (3R)-2'-hydroxyisoflavanone reductase [Helianthus annuus]KAJ0758975.1 putative (3R)-2'-hydroxyisoflavanone reductase [Helianthus annuus]KAJ0762618.1 putative (3R)-2'-hydroxyisoflavanone reductase [Helianthus annuus]